MEGGGGWHWDNIMIRILRTLLVYNIGLTIIIIHVFIIGDN